MQTTNDMPIVYPPSFKTLGFFLSTSTHIFLTQTCNQNTWVKLSKRIRVSCLQHHPVLGLREGSWLKVDGDQVIVKGEFSARLFKSDR
jgi:dipeptidase E